PARTALVSRRPAPSSCQRARADPRGEPSGPSDHRGDRAATAARLRRRRRGGELRGPRSHHRGDPAESHRRRAGRASGTPAAQPAPRVTGARNLVEDAAETYERLTGKLALEALSPSSVIFSPDFHPSRLHLALSRALSLLASV